MTSMVSSSISLLPLVEIITGSRMIFDGQKRSIEQATIRACLPVMQHPDLDGIDCQVLEYGMNLSFDDLR